MLRPSEAFDVHPNDQFMTSKLAEREFDVIAIGSGWASRESLKRLAARGFTTLLIENELVGGDCPFWACVPSKVLLRPQEALDIASGISGSREGLKRTLDVDAIFSRRDEFTGRHNDATTLIPMMQSAGITAMVRGVGSIVGERKVQITPSNGSEPITVKAKSAVILGTGSDPIYPTSIKGLREANIWSPRDATSSSVVPKHLIILGAGAVGTEMAFAYRSLGAEVTLISSSNEILPRFDEEAGKLIHNHLETLGGTVKTGTKAVEIKRDGETITVTLSNGENITGNEALLATGRKPKSEALNLKCINVNTDQKGFVEVKSNLLVTGTTWLYAGGDLIGHGQLTHTAKYHARIISNAILADGQFGDEWSSTNATADAKASPQVVFSHPPVASVGLTRKSAASMGIKTRQITAPFASLGGRIASDKTIDGWAQWLVNEHNVLVGATMVGFGADEQIHASTVAVAGGLTLERLMHAIPSFPSLSEVYLNLIDAAGL